jgi:hypothetical protein
MAESNEGQRRRGAQSIAELVGRVIDPLTKKKTAPATTSTAAATMMSTCRELSATFDP